MDDLRCKHTASEEARLNRHLDQLHVPDVSTSCTAIPWTAARCNRLLRPISSKIALLRKEKRYELLQSHETAPNSLCKGVEMDHEMKTAQISANTMCLTTAERGDEWDSSPRPRKKIKRTYSSKSRFLLPQETQANQAEMVSYSAPGQNSIGLPSPFTSHSRPLQYSTSGIKNESQLHSVSEVAFQRPLPQNLPKNLATTNWKLNDGICKGFMALLRATHENPPRIGSRSLLSTCLTQTPQYIANEEVLSKFQEPDDDADISNMVYEELEELGTLAGGGWEPLRILVRAHGVAITIDAIKEGIIEVPVARHLYFRCLDVGGYQEAQLIFQSLFITADPANNIATRLPKQIPDDLGITISSLNKMSSRHGRHGTLFRQISELLDHAPVGLDWVSSDVMVPTWNEVIRSIGQGDGHSQAAILLLQKVVGKFYTLGDADPQETIHDVRLHIRQASRRSMLRSAKTNGLEEQHPGKPRASLSPHERLTRDSVHQTIFNILTVISAISCLQIPLRSKISPSSQSSIADLMKRLALDARREISLAAVEGLRQQKLDVHLTSLRLPLLAGALMEIVDTVSPGALSTLPLESLSTLASLSTSKDSISGASEFICAVARCCEMAKPGDSFGIIQAIVQGLISTSKSGIFDKTTQFFCRELALGAAFAYSEDTNQPIHLDWALQVEMNLGGNSQSPRGTRPGPVMTPARGTGLQQSGYRWEEGICEWIAKTPDVVAQESETQEDTISNTTTTVKMCGPYVKHAMAPTSESSPCTRNKRFVNHLGSVKRGEVRALHVCIKQISEHRGGGVASEKVRFRNACRPPEKRSSQTKRVLDIYEDDELDELSTPESSQEDSFCTLPDFANAIPGAGRQGLLRRKISRNKAGTFVFTSSADSKAPAPKDWSAADTAEDELG